MRITAMKAPKLTGLLTLLSLSALDCAWFVSPVCEAQAQQEKAVPIAKLKLMLKEADVALEAREYANAATKTEALIKVLSPQAVTDEVMERLYFNIGYANLLNERFPEAEVAFTNCATKYPKGLLASRCALGVGKACIGQNNPPKMQLAVMVLKVAMQDPKLNPEAGLALAQLYRGMGKRKEALGVIDTVMAADIHTPGQTAAALGVINLRPQLTTSFLPKR